MSPKTKPRKGLWSPEEDEKLVRHITKYGHKCWSIVPKQAGLQRCGKSCRLRWINYLRPDLKRGHFSPEEEDLIVKLHAILGNRWAQMATQLPGRTDNEIKNFWNTCLRRKLRQIGIDPHTHKPLSLPSSPPESSPSHSNSLCSSSTLPEQADPKVGSMSKDVQRLYNAPLTLAMLPIKCDPNWQSEQQLKKTFPNSSCKPELFEFQTPSRIIPLDLDVEFPRSSSSRQESSSPESEIISHTNVCRLNEDEGGLNFWEVCSTGTSSSGGNSQWAFSGAVFPPQTAEQSAPKWLSASDPLLQDNNSTCSSIQQQNAWLIDACCNDVDDGRAFYYCEPTVMYDLLPSDSLPEGLLNHI